jgi:TetR/AcrR family transcriptional regulator, mexJK operon transcriptional repressor
VAGHGTARLVRQGRPTASEQGQVDARLLDAARDVFIERGYAAATIDAIVERAQTSKRTVYSRFGDKAALFEAVVLDVIKRRFEPAEAIVRETASNSALGLRDRLLQIGHTFFDAAVSPISIALNSMIVSQADTPPLLAAQLQTEGHDRAIAIVRDLLEEAGATRANVAAEAFYSLFVLAPIQSHQITKAGQKIDFAEAIDFFLAGSGISIE